MTNRQRLNKSNMYDILEKSNRQLRCEACDFHCLIEFIRGERQYVDDKRCFTVTNVHDCGACISKWLNEEES